MAGGRGAAGQRDEVGLLGTVKLAHVCPARGLAIQGRLQPTLDKALADAADRRLAHLDRSGDGLVHPGGATRTLVGFQEDPGVGQLAGRRGARREERLELLPLWGGQDDRIFLLHAPRLAPTDQ